MRRHAYYYDTTDALGRKWCACKRLKTHPVHNLPETPESAVEIDARRMGEAGEGDD